MSDELEYLVVKRGPGCTCTEISVPSPGSAYAEVGPYLVRCRHGSSVREATAADHARALLDSANLQQDAEAVGHLSVWFQELADAILSCERTRADEKRFLEGSADLLRGVTAKLEALRVIGGTE